MNELLNNDSLQISITLPNGWEYCKINYLINKTGIFCDGDWIESKDQDTNGDVRLIQLADIGDGYFRNKSDRFLTKEKAKELNCTFLKKGDLLIARLGEPLGKSCIFPGDKRQSITAVDVCIIRTNDNNDFHNWLKYTINSPFFRKAIAKLQSGTTRKRISRKNLAKISFPLPPLPEQHRIVAKIEELFTRLDAGVEALQRAKTLLKRYRQSVLKAAVEGRLTEDWRKENGEQIEPASVLLERIQAERKQRLGKNYKPPKPIDTSNLPELPEGWAWARVASIGEVVTGTTPSKKRPEYYGNGYPFYKPTDLNCGYYVHNSADSLSVDGIKRARLLPENTVLVTCIGATIGKTGLIRRVGASNQQINAILNESAIIPEYLFFSIISPFFQNRILSKASSTTLPILNKSKFEELPIMIPSTDEQLAIVSEIERLFSIIDESEQIIDAELQRSQSLRQSILKRAFAGKLVPQDPADEPASVLLERIRKEKKI